MSALKRLLDEIHRRSLWQVLGVYFAGAWAVLQVADQLINQLILPSWIYRSVLVLLLLGLPVVLVTAFLQRGMRSPPDPGARALKRVFTWRNALLAGVMAFVLLGLGALGYMSSRALGVGPAATLIGRGLLAERGRVVVADFAAGAQDSSLAAAVTEAVRIDLAQSPALAIVDRAAIADALARMQRPPSSATTVDVAREIAQRDGAQAVIAGALNRVGPGFVLTADVLLAETGESIVSARESAPDSSEIIAAIDRLSRRLRERIGESLPALRGNQALDRITTESLEALRLYSRARDAQFLEGDDLRSIALFEEVIHIDSTFAMAWDGLATAYSNAGMYPRRYFDALENAYRFRERASRRERYLIEGNYQLGAAASPQKAVTAYRFALELAPGDREVLYNLGEAYGRLHDYARQEASYRQAMQSGSPLAMLELVEALTHQGRLVEAKAAIDTAAERLPLNIDVDLRRFYLATLQGDYVGADRYLLEGRRARPEQTWSWQASLGWLSLSAIARGRLEEAARLWRQKTELAEMAEPSGVPDALRIAFARSWFLGDRSGANRIVDAALQPQDSPAVGQLNAQLAGFYVVNGDPARARLAAGNNAGEPDWLARHPWEMVPQAWIALADGQYQRAAELWRRETEHGACPVCSMWLIGLAYDRGNMPDSALAAYERYLSTPWLRKILVDAYAKPYVLERLAHLHDAKGNREQASTYYAAFAELWTEADSALQPRVRAARQRLATVRAAGS